MNLFKGLDPGCSFHWDRRGTSSWCKSVALGLGNVHKIDSSIFYYGMHFLSLEDEAAFILCDKYIVMNLNKDI